MHDIIEDLLQYVRGVWLKRRYILIVPWIVCPIGWAFVTLMPNQFTSEARVYADTRSILQPLLRGLAIQTDPTQELRLLLKTLINRSNLEEIARATDADIRANNAEEYEALIADLKNNIKLKSTKRENLYTISFEGDDATYVRDVVQATLDVFVESALGEKRLDTDQANEFITQQIKDYEIRLIEAETKLADFKRENSGYLPGSDRNYYARMEGQKELLDETQLQLNEVKSRLRSARAQLQTEASLLASQKRPVSTEFDDRIFTLQSRLDDLLFRYTDRHPDVIEARRQLEDLKKLQSSEVSRIKASQDSLANNSSVYQDLKIMVSELENEVASLEVRNQRYFNKVEDLKSKLDQVPDVEANLISLTRNYDITKSKYEELLSRKESAIISQNVGQTSENIKFRIVDPPRIPTAPSGPMRLILLVVVLIVGVGGGVALSFLMSQISPVISSSRQLYQITGAPVFGAISATEISGIERWQKNKMRLFLLGSALLALVFSAFFATNYLPDVHERVMQEVSFL